MKNLNLENYGVQEMNANEMKEVKGGGFFGALLGFVVGVVLTFVDNNPDNDDKWFTNGLICGAAGSALPF